MKRWPTLGASRVAALLLAVGAISVAVGACIPKTAASAHDADDDDDDDEDKPVVASKPAPAMPGVNVPAIKVDTVGYPTGWKKLAIFNVEPKNALVKTAAGAVAYTFKPEDLVARGKDEASGDPVWQADFSALVAPGRYTVEGDGAHSDPFVIADEPYRQALSLGQKHFYLQRCRTALVKPYAVFEGDEYLRAEACHQHEDIAWDLNEYPEKKTRWKPEAGWHDAGNFEMYVPSTAPSAQSLLYAYEAHPEAFADGDVGIPESGNGVPDLLDEARYGITWVLSMRDPSGAFRHREAIMKWADSGPAYKDKLPRWVAGVGTASTAKAASLLAVASRVYAKTDAAFARRCEEASRGAWTWLEQHPERVTVDSKGSEQPLWDDDVKWESVDGAWLAAAAEIWRTFRVPSALEKAKKLLDSNQVKPDKLFDGAWGNLSRWGLIALASDAQTPADVRDRARKLLLDAVAPVKEWIEQKDGYRCGSKPAEYYWGHNSNLLEKTHVLLEVARLDPSATWAVEASRDQWHWILGRNPNGFSMVTRVGKGPQRMYHTEWGESVRPAPGYLVGGPNGTELKFLSPGAPAKAILWDNPMKLSSGLPPHSLWHSAESDLWDAGWLEKDKWNNGWWAATEPDIIYNAALVLVGAYMR